MGAEGTWLVVIYPESHTNKGGNIIKRSSGNCCDETVVVGEVGVNFFDLAIEIRTALDIPARSQKGLWLTAYATDVQLAELNNYIENNKDSNGELSLDEQEFAQLAIEAMDNDGIDDGEVDYDDEIINTLTGKAPCIYEKLESSSTGFKNAIKKFDGDFPVAHLKFEADATMSSNTRKGYTRAPENYVIDIVINGNPTKDASYQKRPNLLIAKTIVHEVIHAEMFRKLISLTNNNGSIDVSLINQMLLQGDYPGMLDYYFRNGSDINSNWQHQQMAAHYRDVIADALKSFDGNGHSQQFYEDLAWEGLIYSNDPTWNSLSPSEKTRIRNTINSYINENQNETCTE